MELDGYARLCINCAWYDYFHQLAYFVLILTDYIKLDNLFIFIVHSCVSVFHFLLQYEIHTHTHAHMLTCSHAHTHTCSCSHSCSLAHHTHTHTHTHMHTPHTHTHTHTHANIILLFAENSLSISLRESYADQNTSLLEFNISLWKEPFFLLQTFSFTYFL